MLAQPGAGPVEQPQPAEGVLHEVADNPVRGEELGDGRDVLRGHGAFAGHDLVLPVGDVELVEPAQNLDIGSLVIATVLIPDLGAEAVEDGVLGEEVIGQEEFRLIIELLEEIGQQGVVEMAGGKEEVPIDLPLGIRRRDVPIEKAIDPLEMGVGMQFRGQSAGAGELEKFRLDLCRAGGGDDPGMEGVPAPGIHEAEGGETVEPGVGHLLDQPGPVLLGEPPQRGHLRREGGEEVGCLRREHVIQLARDRLHELPAHSRGERFKGGGVHENQFFWSNSRPCPVGHASGRSLAALNSS